MQKLRRRVVYWFALHDLLRFSYNHNPRPPAAQGLHTHSGLDPSTAFVDQENALQTCLQASLTEAFLSRSSLFSDDPNLCQLVLN